MWGSPASLQLDIPDSWPKRRGLERAKWSIAVLQRSWGRPQCVCSVVRRQSSCIWRLRWGSDPPSMRQPANPRSIGHSRAALRQIGCCVSGLQSAAALLICSVLFWVCLGPARPSFGRIPPRHGDGAVKERTVAYTDHTKDVRPQRKSGQGVARRRACGQGPFTFRIQPTVHCFSWGLCDYGPWTGRSLYRGLFRRLGIEVRSSLMRSPTPDHP